MYHFQIFQFAFSCETAKNTRYIEMHLSALLCLTITCALAHSAVGITEIFDSDTVYFPDQAEYIKFATKCKDNMVLWPGNYRCYVEGEQGPCNVGRVLIFDRRLLKPYCKDLIFWRSYVFPTGRNVINCWRCVTYYVSNLIRDRWR